MYLCQLQAASSIGPMSSIPQATNGQGELIAWSSWGGTCIRSSCTWHLWHFCTNLKKSFYIVILKYPDCRIFLAKVIPFICVHQTPACICSISFAASTTSTNLRRPKSWVLLYKSWVLLYRTSPLRKKLRSIWRIDFFWLDVASSR